MNSSYYILNASVVNEGRIFTGDVAIRDGIILKVIRKKDPAAEIIPGPHTTVIDATGKYLIPGVIDDQVHFRDPGLTHKGDIYTESKAAVAGGVTSFMDMPNTSPPTLTQELLEQRYKLGSRKSLANYSFYMGTSNDNADEVLKTNPSNVCGIKIFLGASTGNLLVDNIDTLNMIFSRSKMLVAVHCEDEQTIRANLEFFREKYGDQIPFEAHPLIRNENACYKSSKFAVSLAKVYGTRLHVLHLSTAKEMDLFDNSVNLHRKKITAEVCVHHLWFNSSHYGKLGSKIKWNPAIKSRENQEALFNAVLDDRIDIIATDHAPHTIEEKNNPYLSCPSGGPLVQHSLNAMLDFYQDGKISLEKIVEKMCHSPAICFRVEKRGFIREGYHADLVLMDLGRQTSVNKNTILYKCGWSPFQGHTFKSKITHTFVNGNLVYHNGKFNETFRGQRLLFER